MISTALLLLAAQPSAQAAPATADEEIVVIGERLRKVRFKMKRNRKTMVGSCRVTRTSGDAKFDALVCETAVVCMGTTKVTGAAFSACMGPRIKSGVQSRRERRGPRVAS